MTDFTYLANAVGDYYGPHFLDAIREKPKLYNFEPLDARAILDQNDFDLW